MKLLINYADHNFTQAQRRNTGTGLSVAKFDRVLEFGLRDIDAAFYSRNRAILSQKRGAGYWLWKPYIITRALDSIQDGDFLCYSDAGAEFVGSIDPLVAICQDDNQDVMVFELDLVEKHWTKRDTFVLMDCDYPEYTDTPQRLAGFILCRRGDFARQFMCEYLSYSQDARLVTDMENGMGYPNYEGFVEHRHDQSILSLLSKKFGLRPHRDPSQWGKNAWARYPQSRYGQLIYATRMRNSASLMTRSIETIRSAKRWFFQG